MQELLTRYGLR
ncbi:hypothetical protein D030_2452A, partial [Vibrio parahaemolyticus AQ3810]